MFFLFYWLVFCVKTWNKLQYVTTAGGQSGSVSSLHVTLSFSNSVSFLFSLKSFLFLVNLKRSPQNVYLIMIMYLLYSSRLITAPRLLFFLKVFFFFVSVHMEVLLFSVACWIWFYIRVPHIKQSWGLFCPDSAIFLQILTVFFKEKMTEVRVSGRDIHKIYTFSAPSMAKVSDF